MNQNALKDILKAQKLMKRLREESGVVSIDGVHVRMCPEKFLEMFPEEREALKVVTPVSGKFIKLGKKMDGVVIFTDIATVEIERLLGGG